MTPQRRTPCGRKNLLQLAGDERGAAAVEFVLWIGVLVLPILSVMDLSFYTYQRMQVELSAEAAVQAAWHACTTTAQLPAIKNCSGVASAMQAAAQKTSLGTNVTVASADIVEGYYCSNGSGGLVQVGTTGTAAAANTIAAPSPNNCTSVIAGNTTAPGDYIQARVQYTYTPLSSSAPVASLLPTNITMTAWYRLN